MELLAEVFTRWFEVFLLKSAALMQNCVDFPCIRLPVCVYDCEDDLLSLNTLFKRYMHLSRFSNITNVVSIKLKFVDKQGRMLSDTSKALDRQQQIHAYREITVSHTTLNK